MADAHRADPPAETAPDSWGRSGSSASGLVTLLLSSTTTPSTSTTVGTDGAGDRAQRRGRLTRAGQGLDDGVGPSEPAGPSLPGNRRARPFPTHAARKPSLTQVGTRPGARRHCPADGIRHPRPVPRPPRPVPRPNREAGAPRCLAAGRPWRWPVRGDRTGPGGRRCGRGRSPKIARRVPVASPGRPESIAMSPSRVSMYRSALASMAAPIRRASSSLARASSTSPADMRAWAPHTSAPVSIPGPRRRAIRVASS